MGLYKRNAIFDNKRLKDPYKSTDIQNTPIGFGTPSNMLKAPLVLFAVFCLSYQTPIFDYEQEFEKFVIK